MVDMRRLFQIAVLSFVGALVCAFLFMAALHWTVPRTDATYGVPLGQALWDPFVLSGIALVSAFSCLITVPTAYYLLRGRRILPCAKITILAVAAEIILVTPFSRAPGFFGAFIVLIALLVYCKCSKRYVM
jgi:hypothetical protein